MTDEAERRATIDRLLVLIAADLSSDVELACKTLQLCGEGLREEMPEDERGPELIKASEAIRKQWNGVCDLIADL